MGVMAVRVVLSEEETRRNAIVECAGCQKPIGAARTHDLRPVRGGSLAFRAVKRGFVNVQSDVNARANTDRCGVKEGVGLHEDRYLACRLRLRRVAC